LNWIHVAIFTNLKSGDAVASDYWAVWVLLLTLLRKFEVREVVKALPMMWRLLDVVAEKLPREQRVTVEGIFFKFLTVVADTFKIPVLKAALSRVRKLLLSFMVGN
jgi:hypothetical protein